MDDETNTLIARWYMAEFNYAAVGVREFSDWAIFQLEAGQDSKHLRMLAASFDAQSLSEIEGYFRQCLQELG